MSDCQHTRFTSLVYKSAVFDRKKRSSLAEPIMRKNENLSPTLKYNFYGNILWTFFLQQNETHKERDEFITICGSWSECLMQYISLACGLWISYDIYFVHKWNCDYINMSYSKSDTTVLIKQVLIGTMYLIWFFYYLSM